MQATYAMYRGNSAGTRLVAAVLALAGAGAIVGGNLGIAAYYAANAAGVQSMLAAHADTSRHIARITCNSNAS